MIVGRLTPWSATFEWYEYLLWPTPLPTEKGYKETWYWQWWFYKETWYWQWLFYKEKLDFGMTFPNERQKKFFDFATFDVAANYEKQFGYNLSLYLSCEKLWTRHLLILFPAFPIMLSKPYNSWWFCGGWLCDGGLWLVVLWWVILWWWIMVGGSVVGDYMMVDYVWWFCGG